MNSVNSALQTRYWQPIPAPHNPHLKKKNLSYYLSITRMSYTSVSMIDVTIEKNQLSPTTDNLTFLCQTKFRFLVVADRTHPGHHSCVSTADCDELFKLNHANWVWVGGVVQFSWSMEGKEVALRCRQIDETPTRGRASVLHKLTSPISAQQAQIEIWSMCFCTKPRTATGIPEVSNSGDLLPRPFCYLSCRV